MKKIVLGIICICTYNLLPGQIRYNNFNKNRSNDQISYAVPKQYEIADIEVSGAEYLDHNALISLSGLKVGDKIKIPGDNISGAIKKLWGQGLMGNVSIYSTKIENGKISLRIELTERPRLSKITYKGVNKTQEGELDDDIKLIKGRVLTDAILKNTELTVKKHFVEKGFLNTEVKVTRIKDTLAFNSVQLLIDVDKKSKVKINKIYFAGNENFSEAKLKKKLKSTKEHPRLSIFKTLFRELFSLNKAKIKSLADSSVAVSNNELKGFLNDNFKLNFFNGSKFIKSDYEDDKKALIEFYNSKGYRNAKIVSDSVYAHDGKTIDIRFKVDEGRKYYFRDIIWSGNYVYEDDVLKRILGISKGDVYDLELVNKRLNYNPTGADVSSLYLDNGYLFFTVNPVEVRIEDDSIDVEMRIHEGTQATINKVIVKGNDRTNDHVILREIRTLPGQKFSREQLIRTNREIAQLGYFDPEQIGMQPIPNPADGTVDIEYSVVERPSDQIELSGGWGGFYGFVGTLGLVFNNFSIKNITDRSKWHPLPVGDGQKLALRVQANGRAFQNYSFTFTEPWLGGKKPNAFTVNLTRSIQRIRTFETDENGQPIRDVNGQLVFPRSLNDFNGSLKLSGISVSLGRRLRWPDDFFFISNSINYFIYNLDNFGTSLGFSTGISNNLTFNTTISRNSAGPSTMYPTTGSSVSLSMSLTPPYSLFNDIDYENADNATRYNLVEFHKWLFDAKFYTQIIGNLVLESRAHLGFIGSYTRKAGIGPFERFVMGGSGLGGQNFLIGNDIIGLRGYEDNTVTPPNYTTGTGNLGPDQIRGGVVYNKFVFELRYPVSLNPSATIYVLGFGEAGNNWAEYRDFNINNLYKSAGFGARIFMPAFGLIGIDWAYGFDTLPGTSTKSGAQFHFTIGQQLR
ncbi:POTRA domain-containing protein [Fulvivirgaceae bacterium BMA12]|uniref:POTRA domain-containing protein n=1 Tax=Agaribacillus aureus TaxID=3051825 RepID=A0ABT8LHK5_9BACT|nr:POTRA domain-containing protein [Fulvivirgaceae bacterium BMA12]